MVLFPPEAKILFFKAARPHCRQGGLLFDWNLRSLPAFKGSEVIKMKT
jgi:hypothetical protein